MRHAIGTLLGLAMLILPCTQASGQTSATPTRAFGDYRDVYFMPYHHGYRDGAVDRGAMAKFQFSAQANLIDGTFPLQPWDRGRSRRARVNAFMGYTQKSFWRLYDDSAPFLEHNFNPELFLAYADVWRLDRLQLGLIEHESTGVAFAESRGWNRFYLLASKAYTRGHTRFLVEAKAWGIYDSSDRNRDMEDYQRGRLGVTAERSQRFRLAAAWRPGQEKVGNYELEAAYRGILPLTAFRRLASLWGGWDYDWEGIYTSVRWWDGYGEGLVEFNQPNRSLSVGLSMARQF